MPPNWLTPKLQNLGKRQKLLIRNESEQQPKQQLKQQIKQQLKQQIKQQLKQQIKQHQEQQLSNSYATA